ncbi:MAG: hypothetical protein HY769_04240 [Candidatus Stahlbacteria bacterium]|nr:hypothetical protein [Candidatus Stahlbacteria bacterium]
MKKGILSALLVVALIVSAEAVQKVAPKITPVPAKGAKAVPSEINYQGYLASATDTVGITATLDMVFRIFDAEIGGALLWEQPPVPVNVDKGIFNVLLGTFSPIPPFIFDGTPRWLETQVGPDLLAPRKKIVSVAYAMHADFADIANWATNANHANYADTAAYASGGGAAGYADSAGHLVGPDVIQANTTGAVIYVQNTNANGTGIAIDVSGSTLGSDIALLITNAPDTAIYLDNGGYYGLVVGTIGNNAIKINNVAYDDAIRIIKAGGDGIQIDTAVGNGVNIVKAGGVGVEVQNSGTVGMRVDTSGAGSAGMWVVKSGGQGFGVWDAGASGVYVNNADENGVYVNNADSNGVRINNTGGHGIKIGYAQKCGVFIDSSGSDWDGIWVSKAGYNGLTVQNAVHNGLSVGSAGYNGVNVDAAEHVGVLAHGTNWGAAFYNNGASYPTLYLRNEHGATSADHLADFYAGTGTLRFYFRGDGNAYADAGWNTFKSGGKGNVEPYHSMETRDKEIVSSGSAKLSNGATTVNLDPKIAEFVSNNVDLKITVTPKGNWSGLYIASRSADNFVVKSGAGDQNVEFDWMVIAREKGYEQRVELSTAEVEQITSPSHTEPNKIEKQEPTHQPTIRTSKATHQENGTTLGF